MANLADLILVMTVKPGFGGQEFHAKALAKIRRLRKLFPDKDIEVDGGITADTAVLACQAGANVLVAGSAIFNSESVKRSVENLYAAGIKGRERLMSVIEKRRVNR